MSSLPVISRPPPLRPSKNAPRRAAVLIAVHVLIAAHVAHWLLAGTTMTPLEPSEAMELGKHGVVNAGLLFFAAAILATAVFGRFFCGWGCHLVALQDLCRWLLHKAGLRPLALRSKSLRLVPLVAFIYMFLWPVAYRLWIGDELGVEKVELTTSSFWATFPGFWVAALTFFVCGFAIVYFLGAKGFCTYACPYGAAFGLADRVAPGRIRVTDACSGCGHCTAVCTSNVRVHEEVRTFGAVTDPGCMKCMDCVSVCPEGALHFGFGAPAFATAIRAGAEKPARRKKLALWEEGLLAALFAAAFFAFRGLHGVVPFLLALGLAAILAFLGLQLARMVTRRDLTLRRMAFKRAGRIQPAGRVFAGVMTLVAAFWAYGAWWQIREHRREAVAAPTPEAYARAIAAEPASPVGYLGLGLHRVEHGDLEAAGSVFEQGLAASSASAELYYNAGLVKAMTGEPEAAIARFGEALVLDPLYLEARENLAGVLCSVGRFREGLEHYASALEQSPDDPATRLLMARAHLALGEPTAAEAQLERALELDPSLAQARRMLEEIAGAENP